MLDFSLINNVVENSDHQSDHEEQVHHNVVIVPECKISFLESPLVWVCFLLKPPEKPGRANISHAVGGDEDSEQGVDQVDGGDLRLGDVADDE